MIRKKTIHKIKVIPIDSHNVVLNVLSSAGNNNLI
jgi:hypothetical protein